MATIFNYVWILPLMPLAGFLINGLLRGRLSKSLTAWIACGAMLVSFLISLGLFNEVRNGHSAVIEGFTFINVGKLQIPFALQIDALSVLFSLIITGVGLLIHIYSAAYMHEEDNGHYARYFAYLNLFVFSMLLLVLGANYVIMFIGWEGVGLCSYLLIGYWFRKEAYASAAKKAFVMNRIGDLGFLLAVFWMINEFGTVTYSEVFARVPGTSVAILTGITLLLFVGATGKSAQIPLFTWLPDAMAGPTPVSALIHAATMVTAGIYMIARSNIMYSLAPLTREVVAVIGLATALLAASIALYQNDIKKVLAYSTVSQLGFMFLALGVGAYSTGVFHVMTHAFFKALLFLGAGSVIHAMGGEQDIARMGGLYKKIPVTAITFIIGVLAIIGFPFTSGFVSKDEILVAVYQHNQIYFWLAVLGAFLTALYMLRLMMLTFFGSFRGTAEQWQHVHESPKSMTIPLVVLAVLSIAGGWVQLPHIFGGHPYLNEFLFPLFLNSPQADADNSTLEYSLLAGTILILAIIYFMVKRKYSVSQYSPEYNGYQKWLANKWYVDELYDFLVVRPLQWLNKKVLAFVEQDVIDWIVNGVGKAVQLSSRQVRLLQSGQVGSYVLLMVIGILVFFAIEMLLLRQ